MGEARQNKIAREKAMKDAIQNNNCWEQVNTTSALAGQLLRQYCQVPAILNNRNLLAYIEDLHTFSNLIKVLAKDLGRLNEQYKEIKAAHKDKEGVVRAIDADDMLYSDEIHEKYLQFIQLHEATISPVYNQIAAMVRTAEARMQLDAEQKGEQALKQADEVRTEVRLGMAVLRQATGVELQNSTTSMNNMTEQQDPSVVSDAVVVEKQQ